jgi:DNA-binding CsgD family transcriptional regulator
VLFGRDAERAEIGALLEAARDSRSGALVLRGEPGIGKSALLEDTRDRAADMHILSARGVESESELPFAALHQLLRPALGQLERIPPPQAAALRVALGLEAAPADQRFLVFAACLSLLSELAERRPVLCLVDDAHWLDIASADGFLFVARRLEAEGIVMLFAAREGDVRAFDAADIPSLVLEGLDAEAAETLLSRVAGKAAPTVRDRLIRQARGNALALVELPSALNEAQLAGNEPMPETLPLTHQVERIFLERVRRLPDEAQRTLLLAAADDAEDAALVTQAAELLGLGAHALDVAEQAGLVTVHGNRVAFRHPLVRSAVYEAATSSERRDAHRTLADALEHEDQSDRRAWHLAASVLEKDEDAVRALEEAAARAEQRGGYTAAAKALARAAELSEDATARGRRLAGAARAARIAGADDYAVALAGQAQPLVEDPLLEADIASAVGAADVRRGRPSDGLPRLIEVARKVAPLDPHKAFELIIWATAAAWTGGDTASLAELSSVAETFVSTAGDDESTYVAEILAAFAKAAQGGRTDAGELEQVLGWASGFDDPTVVFFVSVLLMVMGEDRGFATLIDRAISLARARGELGLLAEALTTRSIQLAMVQRFDQAARDASESLQFAGELGYTNVAARARSVLAYAAAIRGSDEEVHRYSDEVREVAAAHGLSRLIASSLYALAMLDLGRGRWADALGRFQLIADPFRANLALPDTVEAAVRAGELDTARELLSVFEARAGGSPQSWIQARLESCRAMLTEGDDATARFEKALRFGRDERPFDHARIQLLYGEHLRRQHRRTEARVQLRAAVEGFERLRAEPWAERARAELRATGETARKRDLSTIDQLTPQELQIAGLVAEGLTNKEVAAQLFLSHRTIDYHLRHVFVKLGITSRMQLAGFAAGAKEQAVGQGATHAVQ